MNVCSAAQKNKQTLNMQCFQSSIISTFIITNMFNKPYLGLTSRGDQTPTHR